MLKEVLFDQWCAKCKHNKLHEYDDPCFECVASPVNDDSHKPVNFEEKKGEKNEKVIRINTI